MDIDAHTDVIWLECEEKSHQEHIQPLVRKRLLEDDKGGVLFSYSHFNILEFRMLSDILDTKWPIYKPLMCWIALSTSKYFSTCKIIWYLRKYMCKYVPSPCTKTPLRFISSTLYLSNTLLVCKVARALLGAPYRFLSQNENRNFLRTYQIWIIRSWYILSCIFKNSACSIW